MPTDRSSAQELERGLGVLAGREDRVALYRRIAAQAGLSGLRPAAALSARPHRSQPGVTRADLAEQIGTSTANLAPSLDQLASHELVTIEPSTHVLNLTPNGQSALERLRRAREDGLRELLDDWSPEQEAELDERLQDARPRLHRPGRGQTAPRRRLAGSGLTRRLQSWRRRTWSVTSRSGSRPLGAVNSPRPRSPMLLRSALPM